MTVNELKNLLEGVDGDLPVMFGRWSENGDDPIGLNIAEEADVIIVRKSEDNSKLEAFVLLYEVKGLGTIV